MERECGYCHEWHETNQCSKCGCFLRCEPTSGEPRDERDDETPAISGVKVYHYVVYRHACPRCGCDNEYWDCESVEVLACPVKRPAFFYSEDGGV